MTSETDELREGLTERGIEWESEREDYGEQTIWQTPNGKWCFYSDNSLCIGSSSLTIRGLTPELVIAATLGNEINGDTSDGYHTFNELYHHRAVLFSVIVRDHRGKSWKARKHHDGTMYDGMFIVGIETPKGQAAYHYDLDPYWEMFDCEEREFAPKWDGHTPDEAIARIAELEEKPRDRTEERLLNACNQATQDYVTQLELERDELKARLAELSARAERTCSIIEYDEAPYPVCSECGAVQPDDYTVYFCWNCGAKVRKAVTR